MFIVLLLTSHGASILPILSFYFLSFQSLTNTERGCVCVCVHTHVHACIHLYVLMGTCARRAILVYYSPFICLRQGLFLNLGTMFSQVAWDAGNPSSPVSTVLGPGYGYNTQSHWNKYSLTYKEAHSVCRKHQGSLL